MATYRPGVYLKFDEMEALMKAWAEKYPEVATLESIGTTHGSETTGPGHPLWLLTLTDADTGSHDTKPAFWCDGNTHAGEVTGCQACLHLAHTLLSDWAKKDERTCLLMATSTIYILPRISADGAELYLTTPYTCRSSPMFWPEPEPSPGLQPKDMTGDGDLLLMRIPHSAGSFKPSKKDPRIMLPREPDDDLLDDDEQYYRMLPEGEFLEWDGFTQKQGSRWGLDANRHFPHGYRPEGGQSGAGPHPMFLEEIDAVVKAITARNNICTVQSYHTYSAVVLRPPINGTDNQMPQDDLASFKALDLRAEETTGYPAVAIGVGFKYDPNIDIAGGSNDWMYSDRGILAYCTELWHLFKASGVFGEDRMKPHSEVDHIGYLKREKEEDLVTALKWCDENLPAGSFYADWTPFDHPQLGPVEIGGWRYKFVWQNPPPSLLEAEIAKNTDFALTLARCLPRVRVLSSSVTPLGAGFSKIAIALRNDGWLPTYGTSQALTTASVRKSAKAELKLSGGVELVNGKARPDLPHLAGRSRNAFSSGYSVSSGPNAEEHQLEWIVRGSGEAKLSVDFQRAGTLEVTVGVDGDATPAAAM